MAFSGFWGEILKNSQDCKIIRTAPNGFFNISLTLITELVIGVFNTVTE